MSSEGIVTISYKTYHDTYRNTYRLWKKGIVTPLWYEVCILLDDELDLYSGRSLKQQSVCRHVAPLGHNIRIPSKPVFAPVYSLMLSAWWRSSKYQFYSLRFEHAIYHFRGDVISR